MLGDLIARLNREGVAASVIATLDPAVAEQLERRAESVSMTPSEFASGAVREFVERADDELWFELLTLMRKADDPGLTAIQTILRWTVVEQEVHTDGHARPHVVVKHDANGRAYRAKDGE